MAGILLNLLAATAGGQITRSEAFLRRFRYYNGHSRLVIVKDYDSLSFCGGVRDWEVINVPIGTGRLKALRRMVWENMILPRLMDKEQLNVYLTFSHYVPIRLHKRIRSIVGVSNLAPFSTEAWGVSSHAVRFKMWLLRHSIISSATRAHQVLALSNTCKNVLVEYGVEEHKIKVIPNGVEICRSTPDRTSTSDSPFNFPYILSVSHFHRYKNFERLLEAYKLLSPPLRERFSLVIVGKPYDEKYCEEVKDLIARLRLGVQVYIVPGVSGANLDALYRNASLFVFTSLIENSPNVLLEAMAHGLPILASNVEPMHELGADGIRYFERLSAQDLAEKMSEILLEPDDAAKLRQRAKTRANNFSWDVFTKGVLDMCADVSDPGTL